MSDNIQSQINTAIAGNVWDNIGVKIHYNSGNVGIGTNDPTGKLEVHDGPIIVKPGTNATNALQFHSGSETLIILMILHGTTVMERKKL